MKVNIERAIKSIKGTIDFYQPLYEAIVNAFQASADELILNFNIEKDGEQKYVLGYSIKDNGVGFDNANIEHFLTLWTNHKIKIGALGSGRILCLKVFDKMIIESQTKNNSISGQEVYIDFNRNLKANSVEDIAPILKSSKISYTKTTFKNINKNYFNDYAKSKQTYSIDDIQDKIFINLLPLFINMKREKKQFSIYFAEKLWLNETTLVKKFESLNFNHKDFTITAKYKDEGREDENFKFTLTYQIKDNKLGKLEQFYGASDRKVRDFTKSVKMKPLPNKQSGIFCLTSEYFDTRVEDSRVEFVITPTEQNTTDGHPISFPEINTELAQVLRKILFDKFPDIEKSLDTSKHNVAVQFPHLSKYIKDINKLGLSESDIMNEAEDAYSKHWKATRSSVLKFTDDIHKSTKFDKQRYEDITHHFTETGQEQLASYIGYRQTIINMLLEISEKTMSDKFTFDEEDIHNLFMPTKETSITSNPYANNSWIFDDKFMSYIYSASDETIQKIVDEVQGKTKVPKHHKDKRPDLVMFYSDKESEEKDVLIIEFKRLNATLDEKKKAITQLQDYPMYIRKNITSPIRSIFSYTIIDIDEPYREWLTDSQGFIQNSFGDKDNNISAYYKYNPNVKAHINVLSFNQILHDANKRNKVFLNILTKQLDNI